MLYFCGGEGFRSLLTGGCFPISTRQGYLQTENDKDKIKGVGKIHDISDRQGQKTKSPLFSQATSTVARFLF